MNLEGKIPEVRQKAEGNLLNRNIGQPEQARKQRALLMANYSARQVRDRLKVAMRHLEAHGFELKTLQLASRARSAAVLMEQGPSADLIIVGGGDGTLNGLVDALVKLQLPLGILPLGTANDLARTLGIPQDMEGACDVIAEGHRRQIDLGWVNGKHYFNVASLGLSVQITRQLTGQAKRRWGILAYLAAAVRVVRHSRPFHAEIRSGKTVIRVRTVQITVGNGRFYGGGMRVAEDAAIDDQSLDLYSLQVDHWWQLLGLFPALRRGRLANLPEARTLRGQNFEIHTRRPRHINTDGEITTRTPATFRLIPNALTVLAPPSQRSLRLG